MSLFKYIERLKRMDDLIRRKATGQPEEFARKLNVSKSQVLQDIREMREMGAPIAYCHFRKSYEYLRECRLVLDFSDESELKGGVNPVFVAGILTVAQRIFRNKSYWI